MQVQLSGSQMFVYLLIFLSSQSLERKDGGVSPSMPALQTKPSKRCWSRNASLLNKLRCSERLEQIQPKKSHSPDWWSFCWSQKNPHGPPTETPADFTHIAKPSAAWQEVWTWRRTVVLSRFISVFLSLSAILDNIFFAHNTFNDTFCSKNPLYYILSICPRKSHHHSLTPYPIKEWCEKIISLIVKVCCKPQWGRHFMTCLCQPRVAPPTEKSLLSKTFTYILIWLW